MANRRSPSTAKPFRRFAPLHDAVEVDSSGKVDIRKAIFATSDVALDGHKILPGAWQSRDHDGLADFIKQGSPLLWAHDDQALPVGNVVGVRAAGGDLVGAVKFNRTATGGALRDLYKEGSMRSFSVSWIPLEYRYASGPGRAPGAIDFEKVRLLEISAVTLPADRGALVQDRSAKSRARIAGLLQTPPAARTEPPSRVEQVVVAAKAWIENLCDSGARPADKRFCAERELYAWQERATAAGAGPHVRRLIARLFELNLERIGAG